MQIKLLLLIVAVLAPLTGISAQRSSAETNTTADVRAKLSLTGVTDLSDTQGVDFQSYLADWRKTVLGTWEKLLPAEARTTLPSGKVTIRFKILPNGELMKGSMVLEGRSGSAELDRAVWSTLTNSGYQSLPSRFHGPYLELRTSFSYD